MSIELLDINQIVQDYAEEFLDGRQKRHANRDNPLINYDRMYVLHGETKYTRPAFPPAPKSHILFSGNFMNKTQNNQTYALRTDRKTKSTCTISFSKIFSYGGSIQLRLTPPNPIIEANAGFQANMTKENSVTQFFEQKLSWSVDNTIVVPPGHQTKAELVIKEESFNGNFVTPCSFEGEILVTYDDKDTKEHISTIKANVNTIFDHRLGFTIDDLNRPVFGVKGVCKCRFGVEQSVKLTETIIPHDNADD